MIRGAPSNWRCRTAQAEKKRAENMAALLAEEEAEAARGKGASGGKRGRRKAGKDIGTARAADVNGAREGQGARAGNEEEG